jgi:hypothetical protein
VVVSQDYDPASLSGLPAWLDRWSRGWQDGYLMPTFAERAALLQEPGIPPERVRVFPYAVPQAFLVSADRRQARQALGLDSETRCLLGWIGAERSGLSFALEVAAELDHAGYPHNLLLVPHPAAAPLDSAWIEEERTRLGIRGRVCIIEEVRQPLALRAVEAAILCPGDPRVLWHAPLAQIPSGPVLCSAEIYEKLPANLRHEGLKVVAEASPRVWAEELMEVWMRAPAPRPRATGAIRLEEVLPDYWQLLYAAVRRRYRSITA